MRRTHVMHKRDNRRSFPSHFDHQENPRDRRELRWIHNGAGCQVMELDGRSVAEVRPFGEPRYDMLGDFVQPHVAVILGESIQTEFNTLDAARLHCERTFAKAVAA